MRDNRLRVFFETPCVAIVLMCAVACGGAPSPTDNLPPVVAVQVVDVVPTTDTIQLEAERAFTATPKADGRALTGRSVAWASSDNTVATVSQTGVVHGVRAGTATVSATSEGRAGTAFVTVTNPSPVAASIAPASVVAGSAALTVVVTGSNFLQVSRVLWNDAQRTTTYVSPTRLEIAITSTELAAAGTARVAVTTPAPGGGTSAVQMFTISAIPNPAPTLASLLTTTIVAGSNAFNLTADGTNFGPTTILRWDGVERTTTFVSATRLRALITKADIASSGDHSVTVFTPLPGGGTSQVLHFIVTPAPNPDPVITALTPSAVSVGAQAFTLAVTGTGFVTTSSVRVNGLSRITTFVSATRVNAQLLASDVAVVGAPQITVINPAPGGGASDVVALSVLGPLRIAASISLSRLHTCGNRIDGTVCCWGDNSVGAFGTGTLISSETPIAAVSGVALGSVQASVGNTCGLAQNGDAYCWGINDLGQLGNSTTALPQATQPTKVSGGIKFAQMSLSKVYNALNNSPGSHTTVCGLTAANTAYCWGNNADGNLGIGYASGFVDHPVPVVSGGTLFKQISVGSQHVCALTMDGLAYCWGYGPDGELGLGTYESKSVPTAVSGGRHYSTISAGWQHTCAVEEGGARSTWCWGSNTGGAVGQASQGFFREPIRAADGRVFSQVVTGYRNSCGITDVGVAWCWGLMPGNRSVSAAEIVAPTVHFKSIALNQTTGCGIALDDTPYCWGARGTLGDGALTYQAMPSRISGGLLLAEVASTHTRNCAVTTSGATYCWGMLSVAQFQSAPFVVPTVVTGAPTFVSLALGVTHNCGLTASGSTLCWGDAEIGQLGTGTHAYAATPVAVSGGSNFISIAAASHSTCGITSAHLLRCWGHFDAPDVNPFPYGDVPTAIDGGSGEYDTITGSSERYCALRTNGVAYCWGEGPLGNGATLHQLLPSLVVGGLTFAEITTGTRHSCALNAGGAAYCWGRAYDGQVGTGSLGIGDVLQPVAVTGALKFTQISSSGSHTCGLVAGGAAYCWGWNGGGQLGDGTTASSGTPIAVLGGLKFSKIAAGGAHTCAVTTAGEGFCWGYMASGVLGNGTSDIVSTPVRVWW